MDKNKELNYFLSSAMRHAIDESDIADNRRADRWNAVCRRSEDVFVDSKLANKRMDELANDAHPMYGLVEERLDVLRNDPANFGKLQGLPIGPRRGHARESLPILAEELKEYVDEKNILQQYEKLYLLALEAQRAPDFEARDQYVDRVREQIAYCDSLRDGRRLDYERARVGRPSPGWPPNRSSPARDSEEKKAEGRDRDWWREAEETENERNAENSERTEERTPSTQMNEQEPPRSNPVPPPRYRDVDPENRVIPLTIRPLKQNDEPPPRDWWRSKSQEGQEEKELQRDHERERERDRER